MSSSKRDSTPTPSRQNPKALSGNQTPSQPPLLTEDMMRAFSQQQEQQQQTYNKMQTYLEDREDKLQWWMHSGGKKN